MQRGILAERYDHYLNVDGQHYSEEQMMIATFDQATGLIKELSYPDKTVESWTYETGEGHRPLSHRHRNGQVDSFVYTTTGRFSDLSNIVHKRHPDDAKPPVTRFVYERCPRHDTLGQQGGHSLSCRSFSPQSYGPGD